MIIGKQEFTMKKVQNMTWDKTSSSQDIQKATDKIAGALDKTTGKLSTDIKQGTDKLTAAVKDGAKDTVDAVKRIATVNVAGDNQTVPFGVSAIHGGLMDVSETTARLAGHLIEHPEEMRGTTEAAEAIGRQFSELVRAVSQFDEGSAQLRGQVGELAKVSDWIDYRFPNAGVNQGGMSVNNVFCGGMATAPPMVAGFDQLPGQ